MADKIVAHQILFINNVSLGKTTIASNGAGSGDVDVSQHIPSGYKLVNVIPVGTGSYSSYFYTCRIGGTSHVVFQIFRAAGSVTETTPSVTLICERNP